MYRSGSSGSAKAAVGSERIEKQMRKTGNTEFVFERLKIHTEGNVFLPMQALNELRREGIKELTEKIQMQYRREEADCETETKKPWKRTAPERNAVYLRLCSQKHSLRQR